MAVSDFLMSLLPKGIKNAIESRKIKKLQAGRDEIYKAECEAEGRIEDYEHYQAYITGNQNDIEMFERYISEGRDLPRWKYELAVAKRKTEFIRPNNPKDIEERDYWRDNFYPKFLEAIPEGMDLRFHGTPIYNAKAILESGGIFSSVDINEGHRSSTDLSGEISTSSVETLDRTLQGWFADMGAYIRGLPCGCIFAINPRTQRDQELKQYDAMEAVNFREHPEQLYGIFTSKENIPNVRSWLEKAGFDPNMASTFEGFLERLNKEKSTRGESEFDKNVVVKDQAVLDGIEEVSKNAIRNQEENNIIQEPKTTDKEIQI